jgi:hypothetical protein
LQERRTGRGGEVKKISPLALILRINRIVSRRFMLGLLRAHNVVVAATMRHWVRQLGLGAFRVVCQPTHPMQVTGPDGRPGQELVGVIVEDRIATIVHTRYLREDDIVHELLHVARPEWPHPEFDLWTDLLMAEPALAIVVREGRWLDGRIAADFGFKFALPQAVPPVMPSTGKEFAGMKQVTAYNLKTKKQVKMLNPELVTLKNGRKALRGVAADDGKTTVVKMLSTEAIAEWEKA